MTSDCSYLYYRNSAFSGRRVLHIHDHLDGQSA
nr:MAG TPA: hypothetical protein [Inoviridae sp.]